VARVRFCVVVLKFEFQRREGGDGGERWGLVGEKGEDLGDFEAVVVGVPAPQAVDLLRAAPNLRAKAASVHMNPCWSVPHFFVFVLLSMSSPTRAVSFARWCEIMCVRVCVCACACA